MTNIEKLAGIISDYRYLPIEVSVNQHVQNWIQQFQAGVRDDILDEMIHLMSRTYISEADWAKFIDNVIEGKYLNKESVKQHWLDSTFLNIQTNGNSQREMLTYVNEALMKIYSISIDDCGKTSHKRYVYVDDGVFSGKRVTTDLKAWLNSGLGPEVELHIISAVLYLGGHYSVLTFIKQMETELKIKINVTFWRIAEFENRKTYRNQSDVFWVKDIPQEKNVIDYHSSLISGGKEVFIRSDEGVGKANLFSTPGRRELLEREFLIKGIQIRNESGKFTTAQRPLGFMTYSSFGFGSTFVTFRNCPNNCPLVFWAETQSWIPLFKRDINKK